MTVQTFYPRLDPTIPHEVQRHLQIIYSKLNNHGLAFEHLSEQAKAATETIQQISETVVSGGGGGGGGTVSIATATSPGIVKPDNTTISVDIGGTISAIAATATTPGIVEPDDTTITISGGVISAVAPAIVSALGITIDGGTSSPPTGSKGYLRVPFNATITFWELLADQSGSAQITVKKCPDASFPATASIVASAPPNLTSQQKNSTSTLTGWTTAINAGDILEFNLDSVTSCVRLNLELQVTRH